jgi:hypothetical protein
MDGEISAEKSVDNNTGSHRNSELIINTSNVLLREINDNFITNSSLLCLNLFYIVSLFVYNVF